MQSKPKNTKIEISSNIILAYGRIDRARKIKTEWLKFMLASYPKNYIETNVKYFLPKITR